MAEQSRPLSILGISPELMGGLEPLFDEAYQEWRDQLAIREPNLLPVVEASSDGLFQIFFRRVMEGSRQSPSPNHTTSR